MTMFHTEGMYVYVWGGGFGDGEKETKMLES